MNATPSSAEIHNSPKISEHSPTLYRHNQQEVPESDTLTAAEEANFTAFVERQSRFAFRVAYAVLLNAHDAEDAVQETFLKLYRHGGWQLADNERAYIARVAWRCAIDRRRAAHPGISDPEATLEIPSHHPGPEHTFLATDHHRRIHAMIDTLPEELRLPLILSAFDDLNSRLIAGILNIPEGTVRTRL
ncbi:RNA polymerase sigma factor, partial [Terracidiphilus sp.]|uniref:RNA polymerase sigma factor n=1 Tax=Terracidiphilus sp. TaxID=1964191 RepID=UPI003C29217E